MRGMAILAGLVLAGSFGCSNDYGQFHFDRSTQQGAGSTQGASGGAQGGAGGAQGGTGGAQGGTSSGGTGGAQGGTSGSGGTGGAPGGASGAGGTGGTPGGASGAGGTGGAPGGASGAGGTGGAPGGASGSSGTGGSGCGAGQMLCGSICVATNSLHNCGGCNNDCAALGLECLGGVCGCSQNSQCGQGYGLYCRSSGTCSCGTQRCQQGETCQLQGGFQRCACGSLHCQWGQTCCETPSGCFNLQSDSSNCGACGHACPAGHNCMNGTCM